MWGESDIIHFYKTPAHTLILKGGRISSPHIFAIDLQGHDGIERGRLRCWVGDVDGRFVGCSVGTVVGTLQLAGERVR